MEYKRNGSGRPRLTVFGGAFNGAVRRFEVIRIGGGVQELPLREIKNPPKGQPQLGNFRYATHANTGPWCISELITRNAKGNVLWQVPSKEILAYDPERFC